MFKFKKSLIIGMSLLGLFLIAGCSSGNKKASKDELKKVTLILDYLPNTNHTGIYVAKEKGYFKEKGIDLEIIEPGENNTSLALLGAGKADFALSYQEDLTYAQTSDAPIPVTAIATVLEHNTSGFVSLKKDNIQSPKDFEGKVYAGWQSPSEEAMLKAVMTNANADFSKLSIVGNSANGASDLGKNVNLKWFFEGWDLTKAKMDGFDLNYLPLKDLDKRLDYYTPIIVTRDETIEKDSQLVKDFLSASKKGYQDAIKEPKESAKILHEATPEQDLEFLEKSQEFLSKNYTSDPNNWGVMKEEVWTNYTDFMFENKLINQKIDSNKLFTNDFLTKDK
ncbi:ABC transporter substrate-binding protein [Vagococcus hydrophili]|nr:ABC transporter substrate-binding protein [Vagococcus hydrophili]